MSRAEFMRKLAELLADVSPAEREEAIQYYNDYFDDAGAENEQSVISSLGSPDQLAKTIKAGLSDGGNMGEFTEKGFSGYEPKKNNEVLNPNQAVRNDRADGQYSGNTSGGNNAYGYRSADQSNDNSNRYHNSYDRNEYGNNSYGNNSYGSGSYGNGGYQNTHNGNGSYQNAYGNQGNAVEKKNKEPRSGWNIALIVLLCIFASPILIGVGGSLLGGILGILGSLFGCVIGFGVAFVILIIVGVCVFAYGIGLLFGMPLGGLCMMGGGMVCVAIGLFFLWLDVMICGVLLPAVFRGIAKLFQSIFHRGGSVA